MSAEVDRRTETIPEWKREEVNALIDFIERYDSVGVVDVSGIPSRQLQQMRADLHGRATLRMSRNTLLVLALEEVDAGLEALTEYVTGQVGLIGTDDNPFGLYRRLEESKTPAPIGPGETAPNDIVIEAGDTGMDPGPFVGELQAVGAAAQITEGSIRVMEDSVIAHAGDVVSDQLANVLGELGIEPKEVGLDLRGVYADGVLFEADELAIDIDDYRADIAAAAGIARSLSVHAAYPTRATIGALLAKGSSDAKAVGIASALESPDIAPDLITRADAQVRALAAHLPDEAVPEDLRAPVPEEPASSTEPTTDQEPEDPEPDADTVDETSEDDDDDDDAAAAEGLGDMFG